MPDHRFGRSSSWHSLAKMRSDLVQLKAADGTENKNAIIDAAQAAAIAGWSAVDRFVGSEYSPPGTTKEILKEGYPHFAICQSMANEGKHLQVRTRPDDVSLEASVSATHSVSMQETLGFGEAFSIEIGRGDGTIERQENAGEERSRTSNSKLELARVSSSYRAKIVMKDGSRLLAYDVLSGIADQIETLLRDTSVPQPDDL